MSKKVLVLAGTYEARKLIETFSIIPDVELIASYAGVTKNPKKLKVQTRFGGFGGVKGLVNYLKNENIKVMIDATHPFSEQIKDHAIQASSQTQIPLAHFMRPAWKPESNEKWQNAKTIDDAIKTLPANSRPFFAIGKKHAHKIASREDIFAIIRMIEKPQPPIKLTQGELILARATKNWKVERELFKKKAITHLVLRNSGGKIGYAKLVAARDLKIPIIMIERPPLPNGAIFTDMHELTRMLAMKLNSKTSQYNSIDYENFPLIM